MEFWQRARSFAEEAAKRSQELTREAAKRSQDITATIGSSKLSDIVSEAAKRSKEIAAEASKKSIDFADHIKSQIPAPAAAISSLVERSPAVDTAEQQQQEEEDMERFGITDELREFVNGITGNTFRDFPLQDDSEVSDIPTVSNVRQDLTAWQEKHAKLVLSTVKEISKLRYELCPRAMKERKFWRIYFILVNSHVSPYEKRYTEEEQLKSAEQAKEDKIKEASTGGTNPKPEAAVVSQKSKTSSVSEQDLDVFLLGDLADSDDGPDDGDRDFDDDFDKL